MADQKNVLTESEKQARAAKARETRRQHKLAAEQQQERRSWYFDNDLTDEDREQIVSELQEISDEYDRLFEEFIDERDMEITEALKTAIEKFGYHHVLAALEGGEVSDIHSGAVHRDLAEIVVEDFEDSHGWELDPIDEMDGESAADAFIDAFGGRFDEQGNYIPKAGANC
jgi:hypothetical protein